MKRHMLRDAWEIHKVKLAACRATPELKEERETNRKNHIFLKIKGTSALSSK